MRVSNLPTRQWECLTHPLDYDVLDDKLQPYSFVVSVLCLYKTICVNASYITDNEWLEESKSFLLLLGGYRWVSI